MISNQSISLALAALASVLGSGSALAQEGVAEPSGQPMKPEEISAWLESHAVEADVDSPTKDDDDVLPPAPRHRGLVVEMALGALGHVGDLRTVSPVAPRFSLQLGFEVTRWAMLFAESDISFSNTTYAARPPEPRGYALFGFGGGLRLGIELGDVIGIHLQGSVGAGRVNEDVLATYGFTHASSMSPYFGAMLGVDWYQVNPHLALCLNAGVRNYPTGLIASPVLRRRWFGS